MPRKKDSFKGGSGVPRFRENSRVLRAHESVVDLISGRPSASSFLDVFSSGIFGFDLGFLRAFDTDLENDIIYSDSDEDDEPDCFYSNSAAQRPLAPHPQIRQLTQEEADQHAKELLEEEERRKDKTEKNKRKKMRKKEKKRLEKENAVKEIVPEEDLGKSESSENQGENHIIESNVESEESAASAPGETQNETVVAECDESSSNSSSSSNEEDIVVKMNEDGDGEPKDLDLNDSFVSTAAFAAQEPPDQTPTAERKGKKKQLLVVQQPEEEKSDVLEEPEVQKKKEENHNIVKEKTMEANLEDFEKRSRELAGIGNRLAASGQFEVAVKCFTDAIKYNPKEYKLFGNRSLCYERMQQYENALMDADLALSMQPNWIKGLFRKGKALCGLKRYYEASLIYKEVLRLDSSSAEATLELKRAQTLHLMEMGFSWAQSSDALKTHATLEEAVEALFGGEGRPGPGDAHASNDNTNQVVVEKVEDEEGEWIVLPTSRPRMPHVKESSAVGQIRPTSQSPTPLPRNWVKPELFPIWVGSLAPTVTYTTLHTLFSRAGTVFSIKMLLDHQCAFVHFTRKEDCERAIQYVNGMVVEGAPLSVRYPNKIHTEIGVSKSAVTEAFSRPVTAPGKNIKECFFWRTTGCTKQDKCIFRHVPEHKNIDRDKGKL
ncbi:uncharacterized protein [Centroberyx affinis]|uniref:uncharacterized protein n=1 Tax=Centroberyx affinis TaxID=166261 RepID=UPI003A5C5240